MTTEATAQPPLNPDYEATVAEPSDAEAEEIWAEFDASAAKPDEAEQAAPDDPEAADEAQRQANADQAAKAADDDDKDAARGDRSSAAAAKKTDEHAPAAAPKAGDAAPDNKTPADALWTSASPEQQAAFKAAERRANKAEQAYRSREGRLKAQQRQIDDLTTPPKPAAKPVSHETGAPADGAGGDDTTSESFLGSEEWTGFKEEYPEVAGPLGNVIAALESKVTTHAKELSAVGDDRRQEALDEQKELLDDKFPGWTDLLDDNPAQFKAWVDEQPRHIREATQRNATAIVDADEAADVFSRYDAYVEGTKGTGEGQDAAAPRSEQKPGNGSNEAPDKKLSPRRQRQLESADSPAGSGPGVTSAPPDDGQAAWDYYDNLHRKNQQKESERAF